MTVREAMKELAKMPPGAVLVMPDMMPVTHFDFAAEVCAVVVSDGPFDDMDVAATTNRPD